MVKVAADPRKDETMLIDEPGQHAELYEGHSKDFYMSCYRAHSFACPVCLFLIQTPLEKLKSTALPVSEPSDETSSAGCSLRSRVQKLKALKGRFDIFSSLYSI